MKITRYPQSCLVVESTGHKIVIDPGMHFLQSHTVDELKGVEAVLYTHEHPDHFEPKITETLLSQGAEVFANQSTARLIGEGRVTVARDGDSFTAGGMKVTARELPHCLLPGGGEGPQNTGYVIEGILFHPGDGKELAGLQVDNVALPITGPDISMLDAFNFAKSLGARVAIPIHYQWMGADADTYHDFASGMPFEVRVLADGESTEV